jgi:CRP/FNR family transcriptional regulator
MPLTDEEKAAALVRVPLFEGISYESMNKLAAAAGEQDYAAGQFIVRQGQIGTGLYVVIDGSVRVLRGSDALATLGEGEFFGELAVIDQEPRSASVQAVTDTRCLALASWDLLQLLQSDSTLSLNLIRGLVARIRGYGEHHHH